MGNNLPFTLYCYIFTILTPGQEFFLYTLNTSVCIDLTYVLASYMYGSEDLIYVHECPHIRTLPFALNFQLNN